MPTRARTLPTRCGSSRYHAGGAGDRHHRIGLGATVSTTYNDPWSVARVFASLDHISKGRAAWNAVTTASGQGADNFGTTHPDHASRYERAAEFVDVVKGLWDCWADDAIVADRASGTYIDTARMRPLDHDGTFFKVKGPHQHRPLAAGPAGGAAGRRIRAGTGAGGAHRRRRVLGRAGHRRVEGAYAALKKQLAAFGRSPDHVTVLPGVMPVVGRTTAEAREKLALLQSYVTGSNALQLLSDRLGQDVTRYDLDGPLPDLALPNTSHGFAKVMLAKARREGLTLRGLYDLVAAARGHWVLCGSAETVADTLQQWFEERAADGFNVMPPYFPEGFDDFVDLVVPILQERGLFRHEYEGETLRDHLGLPRPPSRFWG